MRLSIIPSGDRGGVARFDDLVVTVSHGSGGYEMLVEVDSDEDAAKVTVDIGNATGDEVVWGL